MVVTMPAGHGTGVRGMKRHVSDESARCAELCQVRDAETVSPRRKAPRPDPRAEVEQRVFPDAFRREASDGELVMCVAEIEGRLRRSGYDLDGIVDGPVARDMTRDAVIARIGLIVNGHKALVRFDPELYRTLAELVHVRIRARGVPLCRWLDLCGLTEACRRFIIDNSEIVAEMIEWFYASEYTRFSRIGLQSAAKYESFYLADLGDGRIETIPQFFTRIAAEAARGATSVPAFAAALSDCCEPATPRTAFQSFFISLCRQYIVPPSPVMLFFGRDIAACASCYLLAHDVSSTRSFLNMLAGEVIPILNNRGGLGLSMQRFNEPPGTRTLGVLGQLKALDSLMAASNSASERPTGLCVYFEPWHSEIMSLLSIRGTLAAHEETRCDNLFTALWIPDLFMRRFMENPGGAWTLFDNRANHLTDLYGDDFDREYCRLEAAGMGVGTVVIRDLMFQIIRSAVSTGTPFLMFKDACNKHYPWDMRGRAIKCSNLCTEIIHNANDELNGVCNLMSVNLAALTYSEAGERAEFDFHELRRTARQAAVFVNVMISLGSLPTEKTRRGNASMRSMGIGIQGLHTACIAQGIDMTSAAGVSFSTHVTELLALETTTVSCELCEHGLPPFSGFGDTYYSNGQFHFDGWPDVSPIYLREWNSLRGRIIKSGLYNCQTVALMPTVSSSQVTEASEGFSPVFSNMYSKISLSGEEVRPHLQLLDALVRLYPNKDDRLAVMTKLNSNQWSVQAALGKLPDDHPLSLFRTAFEMDQKELINLCAKRAPFIDHSQSMTLFVTEEPDGTLRASRVAELIIQAYKQGLKTGAYYCKVRKVTNNGLFTGTAGGEVICSACQ